jgi:hypothetical protein
MRKLKESLLREYGSFSDKRIKNLDKGSLFIVDDRSAGDVGGDRQLYLWFCTIFANVEDGDTVTVSLGNLPQGRPIAAWLAAHGIAQKKPAREWLGFTVDFTVNAGSLERLTSLAQALRAISSYEKKSDFYVCPRTAGSLERLATALKAAWTPSSFELGSA